MQHYWRAYGSTAAVTVAVAVLVGWLGDALKGERLFCDWLISHKSICSGFAWQFGTLTWIIVCLIGCIGIAHRHLSQLACISRLEEVIHAPKGAVILLISPPNHDRMMFDGNHLNVNLQGDQACETPIRITAHGSQASHVGVQRWPWNWQPILQSMAAHAEYIRDVVLIASPQSQAHIKDCAQLINWFLNNRAVRIEQALKTPDFMNLEATCSAIQLEVARLRKKWGDDLEIVINVTGGTKTASIAASIAAIEYDLTLEYVEGARIRCFQISATRWQAW